MESVNSTLRVGYVTSYDPLSTERWQKDHWGYHSAGRSLLESLRLQGIELTLNRGNVSSSKWYRAFREKTSGLLPNSKYFEFCDPAVIREDAIHVKRFFEAHSLDVILNADNCLFFAHPMELSAPRVLYTDTPIAALVDFYPEFKGLSAKTLESLLLLEKASFQQASKIIFYTEWAKKKALQFYSLEEEKLMVTPAGANLTGVQGYVPKQPKMETRRHFTIGLIASRWVHKGGDFALEVAKHLQNQTSLSIQIEIIGASPPKKLKNAPVLHHGWIDKTQKEGETRFKEIVRSWDLVIHPTIADTFGHIICEANALGVPVMVTSLGCMPEMVVDGRTGFLMQSDAPPSDWADRILSILRNSELLSEMSYASYQWYLEKFSWDLVARSINPVLHDVAKKWRRLQ